MVDIKNIQLEVRNNLKKNLLINGSFIVILCMFFFALVDGTLAGIKKTFDLVNSNFFQVWESWLLVALDFFVVFYCLHVFVKLIKVLKSELFIYKDEKEYIETIKKAMARTTYPWGNISIYLLGIFVLYNVSTIIIYAIFEKVSPLNEQLLENGYINVLGLFPLLILFGLVIPIDSSFKMIVEKSSSLLEKMNESYNCKLDIEPKVVQFLAILISITILSILGVMKKDGQLFYEYYSGQKTYSNSAELIKEISFNKRDFFSEKDLHSKPSDEQKRMLNVLEMKQIECSYYLRNLDIVSEYRKSIEFKDIHNLNLLIIKIKRPHDYDNTYKLKELKFSLTKEYRDKLKNFVDNDTLCESPVVEKEKVKK